MRPAYHTDHCFNSGRITYLKLFRNNTSGIDAVEKLMVPKQMDEKRSRVMGWVYISQLR